MTRHSRSIATFIAAVVVAASAAVGCSRPATSTSTAGNRAGGEIVVTNRSNPTTFNRISSHGNRADDLIALLTQAKLVRINRVTWEVEPWLAESWTRSDDGLRYTLKLRPNITFSDGQPFTSDDVAFSLAAVYDDKTASPLKQALQVSGKPLQIATPDPLTVVDHVPVAVRRGAAHSRQPPDPAAPQARRGARRPGRSPARGDSTRRRPRSPASVRSC